MAIFSGGPSRPTLHSGSATGMWTRYESTSHPMRRLPTVEERWCPHKHRVIVELDGGYLKEDVVKQSFDWCNKCKRLLFCGRLK